MIDVGARVVGGLKWLLMSRAATQGVTAVFSILTLRYIAPADYGLMAIAMIFVTFVALFEEFGLRARVVQLPQVSRDDLRAIYGLSVIVNSSLAGLLLAIAPLVAAFYDEPRLLPILFVLAFRFVVSTVAVIPEAVLHRGLAFRSVSIVAMGQGLITAVSGFAMAYSGYGVWALVFAGVFGSAWRVAALLAISPFRAWPSFQFRGHLRTFTFGAYITGQRILWWFYSQLDRFALASLAGTQVLGLYSAASDIARMPLDRLGGVVNLAAFAGLSRVAEQRGVFDDYYLKGVRLTAIAVFPACYGLGAILPDAVPLILGDAWAPIVLVAQLLSIAMPLRLINGTFAESLNALGRSRDGFVAVAILTVTVSSAILLGVSWGMLGVALAWCIAVPIGFALNLATTSRKTAISVRSVLLAIAPAAGAAATMWLVLSLVRELLPWTLPSSWALAVLIGVGVAVYVSALALVDRRGMMLALSMVRGGAAR